MNSFGHNFSITVFGESHGECVGVVIDGVPPGVSISQTDFYHDLGRRRAVMPGTTARNEKDTPRIISGIYEGTSTGAPLTIIFENGDTRPDDYSHFTEHPRPSHADLTARIKYKGFNDPNGGGMFSGRLTVCLVAAGVVAKKLLPDVTFETKIAEIGGCDDPERFDEIINAVASEGNSVGAIVQTIVNGTGTGLGEPFFDSTESVISHLLFSIPAVKGVEFGAGFGVARKIGSENNDTIVNPNGTTLTNNDGGINGGITNGNPLIVRAAIKPTPSIYKPQHTYNFARGGIEKIEIKGRHDACIAPRAAVVIEAAVAIALADLSARR